MKSLLLIVSLLAASVGAHAVTITAGTVTKPDIFFGEFRFISSNFDLLGVPGNGFWGGLSSPVEPGKVVNPSGIVSDSDIQGGSGWINGTYYPDLSYNNPSGPSSSFVFTAPSFIYASERVKTIPFQFSGVISAYVGNDPECLLCNVPIEGGGISVILYNVGFPGVPPGTGEPIDQHYFFFVPEPATAFLLIPGALLLFLLRRRDLLYQTCRIRSAK